MRCFVPAGCAARKFLLLLPAPAASPRWTRSLPLRGSVIDWYFPVVKPHTSTRFQAPEFLLSSTSQIVKSSKMVKTPENQ